MMRRKGMGHALVDLPNVDDLITEPPQELGKCETCGLTNQHYRDADVKQARTLVPEEQRTSERVWDEVTVRDYTNAELVTTRHPLCERVESLSRAIPILRHDINCASARLSRIEQQTKERPNPFIRNLRIRAGNLFSTLAHAAYGGSR